MNNIPRKLRDELSKDDYYSICCVTGLKAPVVKIDWHHAFIFAGRQVQEKWCILPISRTIHENANNPKVKAVLERIMLNRASVATLKGYSKSEDLIAKRNRLNKNHANKKDNPVLQAVGF